jgi:hypothetical protein
MRLSVGQRAREQRPHAILAEPHGEERRAASRLEPWAASEIAAILRDASLRDAPQDEVAASGMVAAHNPR